MAKAELLSVISYLRDERNRLRQEVDELQELLGLTYEDLFSWAYSQNASWQIYGGIYYYASSFSPCSYSSQGQSSHYWQYSAVIKSTYSLCNSWQSADGQSPVSMSLTAREFCQMRNQIRDRWSHLYWMDDRILKLKRRLYELRLFEWMQKISLLCVCLYKQVSETFRFEGKAKWFPNRKRIPCSTMPWMIRPSLVVLWGVCWMFYGLSQPSPSRKPTLYSRDGSQY